MTNGVIAKTLSASAPAVARELLEWEFYVREADGSLTGGIITETEAYTADDEASHSFRGKTSRNSAMFEKAGTIYVYFTYGMHWCCNIVTGVKGTGEAVLIRALEPTMGLPTMQSRRNNIDLRHLCDGPAKLCQALGITGDDNHTHITEGRFILQPPKEKIKHKAVTVTARIGIQRGKDKLWRFTTRATSQHSRKK